MAAPRTTTQPTATATSASPVANPGPLGLSGFALTTFVIGLVRAGVLNGAGDVLVVVALAFFYGGIAQLLAGMWEFRAGNTFGATAFSSYGAFWLSFTALVIPGFGIATAKVGPGTNAIGVYLLGWAIFTGFMAVASLRTNGATAAVFVLLFLAFLFLALGAFGKAADGSGLTALGGWIAILTAIVAWYTAAAGVLAAVSGGRWSLPVFPLAAR